jgi:hypothetical protein
MTTFEMGLTIGIAALLAGGAIVWWLLVTRSNRAVPRCPYCDHARAGHNGTGCHARIALTNGDAPCKCAAPFGEPR